MGEAISKAGPQNLNDTRDTPFYKEHLSVGLKPTTLCSLGRVVSYGQMAGLKDVAKAPRKVKSAFTKLCILKHCNGMKNQNLVLK